MNPVDNDPPPLHHPVTDIELWNACVFLFEAWDHQAEYGPNYLDRAFKHWRSKARRWWLTRKPPRE